MPNRLAGCPMLWLRFWHSCATWGAWGYWDFGLVSVWFSLAALSQISYTFALCSSILFFLFFFLGPIAACGIWQTVVEQAALRANSGKKKIPSTRCRGRGICIVLPGRSVSCALMCKWFAICDINNLGCCL